MNTDLNHRQFVLEAAPAVVRDVPTMMWPKELDLLFSLAKNHFSGKGCVVDAGLFMGASTRCFYEGLKQNPNISDFSIRSYELALKNRFMPDIAELESIGENESYGHILQKNFADMKEVKLHVGDICEQQHDGTPIEIMFLDVVKMPKILHHVNLTFLPSLMVGGTLVQQDFFFPLAWWINGWMNYFSDYFELIDSAETTAVFRLIKPLPPKASNTKFLSNMNEERMFNLLDNPPFNDTHVDHILSQKLNAVHYLIWRRNVARAEHQLREFERKYSAILDDDLDENRRKRIRNVVRRLNGMLNAARRAA